MTDDSQRSLGRLEAIQETHAERLTRIEGKLDHIVSVIDNAKGGWKTLLAVGSVAAAVGAGVTSAINAIRHWHP